MEMTGEGLLLGAGTILAKNGAGWTRCAITHA